MNPSHNEGLAAAKRCKAANDDGSLCDARDAITMLTYHLSLEVRRLEERERMSVALLIARSVIANTKESLD